MIGLFLIYFIGKMFYELAHEHGKSKWTFAILGVISYYAGSLMLGSFIIGVLMGMGYLTFLEDASSMVLSLTTIPLGILISFITYKMFEGYWESRPSRNGEALDNDLIQQQQHSHE
jgi:hypothetical protein